jgi:NADH dehydrogenase [ubiquinone] 1 alpha subcomplex assembly factor 5
MTDPEIFDRALRRRRRDRAALHFADHAFLRDHVADELIERLAEVTRTFNRMLDLGCMDGMVGRRVAAEAATPIRVIAADAGFGFAKAAGGVQCDEDRLPFADASFDLVIATGGLETVNDLPGCLSLIRRLLVPDGLFLGAFVGAGSLPALRGAMLGADMTVDRAVPRIHPQIDVRSAGDLLARAGFALPVADGERVTVRYGDPLRLIGDLRGMAGTNLLRGAPPPVARAQLPALFEAFAAGADADGRVPESFEIVYMVGWSPAPDQPRPAARGSASRSLADALRPPGAGSA